MQRIQHKLIHQHITHFGCVAICVISALLPIGRAEAIPVNPNPAIWAPDSGATIFGHGDVILANEVLVPIRDNPPNVPVFLGFYFDGTDPLGTGSDGRANAAIVFDNGDPVGNTALIHFPFGQVFDTDNSPNTVQSNFTRTPAGSGNIGFFISVLFPGNLTFTTLYSDPALNAGFDLAAAFPLITDPTTFMIAFDVPADPNSFTLAYRVQFRGLSAVPEPGSLALMVLGLTMVGWTTHRLRTQQR